MAVVKLQQSLGVSDSSLVSRSAAALTLTKTAINLVPEKLHEGHRWNA